MSSSSSAPPSGHNEQLQEQRIEGVVRGAATLNPPAPVEPSELPGRDGVLADPVVTEPEKASPSTTDAAAQRPRSHVGKRIDTSGIVNMAGNIDSPLGSAPAEDPASWASAMARIRKVWPEFSDKLESRISRVRTCVRTSGSRIGSQDVYYQLQAGPWVRSVVQLKELLQPTATTTTAATTTLGAAANLAGLVIPAPLGSASAIADDGLHSYQRTPHSPSSRATPTSAAVAALPDMSSAALPSIATPPSSGHRKCGKLEVVTRDDPEQWQEMESYIRRGWSDVTASDLGRIAAGKCLIRQSGIHEGRREWNYQLIGSDDWIRSVPKLRATIYQGTTEGIEAVAAGAETTSIAVAATHGQFATVPSAANAGPECVDAPVGWPNARFHRLRGVVGELGWTVPTQHTGPRASLIPTADALNDQQAQQVLGQLQQQHVIAPTAATERQQAAALGAAHSQQLRQPAPGGLQEMEQQSEHVAARLVQHSTIHGQRQQSDDQHGQGQGFQASGPDPKPVCTLQQQHHQQQGQLLAEQHDPCVPGLPPLAAISSRVRLQGTCPTAEAPQTLAAAEDSATTEQQVRMPPVPSREPADVVNDAAATPAGSLSDPARVEDGMKLLDEQVGCTPHTRPQSVAESRSAPHPREAGGATAARCHTPYDGRQQQQQPKHASLDGDAFHSMHHRHLLGNESGGRLVRRVQHASQQQLLLQQQVAPPPLQQQLLQAQPPPAPALPPPPPPRRPPPPPPPQWPALPAQPPPPAKQPLQPPAPRRRQVEKAQSGSVDNTLLVQRQQQPEPRGGQQGKQLALHQRHEDALVPKPDVQVLQSDNNSSDVLLQMLKRSLQSSPQPQSRVGHSVQLSTPDKGVRPPSCPRVCEGPQHMLQPGPQVSFNSAIKQQQVVKDCLSKQPKQDAPHVARQSVPSYEEHCLQQLEKWGTATDTSSNGQSSADGDKIEERHQRKEPHTSTTSDNDGARCNGRQHSGVLRAPNHNSCTSNGADHARGGNEGGHRRRGSSKERGKMQSAGRDRGISRSGAISNDKSKVKGSSLDRKRSRPTSKDRGRTTQLSERDGGRGYDKGNRAAHRVASVVGGVADAARPESPVDVLKKRRMMADNGSPSVVKAGDNFVGLGSLQELVYLRTEHQRLLRFKQSATQHSLELEKQVKALQEQLLQQRNANEGLVEQLSQLKHLQGLLVLLAQPELEQHCP